MTTRSDLRPVPRAEVMAIEAYVPGKSGVAGLERVYKLSSNETPLGPSPAAVEAFRREAGSLALYPDGPALRLREAIARRYGLDVERIMCGNGSDEILSLIAQVYLRPGDEGLYSQYGFLAYPIAIRAAGATPVVAPEVDMSTSVDSMLSRVTERTRLVFLANPNNPTGTYLPFSEVSRLHGALPGNVLLVLDAAYAEYVSRNDYAAGVELVSRSANVVMTRTFSKIYGLANLRLGWAYGPQDEMAALNRIRGPFNVNGAAQAAGVAALDDEAHIARAVEHNTLWLGKMTAAIEGLGLKVTPSVGNFLLVHFRHSGSHTAKAADAFLSSRGFVLRAVGSYGLPNALRLSLGTEEANLGVISALEAFLKDSQRA